MRESADNYDAELLLRLYELRREEKLRRAREWLVGKFHADSMEEMEKQYPMGSEENALFRMAVSYWDMAASLVNHGLHQGRFVFREHRGTVAGLGKSQASGACASRGPQESPRLEEPRDACPQV